MSKLKCRVVDVVDHDYTPEEGVTVNVRREMYVNGAFFGSLPMTAGKDEVVNCCRSISKVTDADVTVVFDKTPRVENEYLNSLNL